MKMNNEEEFVIGPTEKRALNILSRKKQGDIGFRWAMQELRLKDISTIDARVLDDIRFIANLMVEIVSITNKKLTGDFNDIEISAKPGDTAQKIFNKYKKDLDRNNNEYLKSHKRREAQKRDSLQMQMDMAIRELRAKKFNWSDLNNLIIWIGKICEASDHPGVKTPREKIISCFAANGYHPYPDLYTTKNLKNDENNFARWLIAEALESLEIGGINKDFHEYADAWRGKFGYVTPCNC